MNIPIANLIFLCILIPKVALAADCDALKNSSATITSTFETSDSVSKLTTEPKVQLDSPSFQNYAFSQARFLCSFTPPADRCLEKSLSILASAQSCLKKNSSIKEIYSLATSYLRNPEVSSIISESIFRASPTQTETVQRNIWRKFRVLVLPAGLKTKNGLTQSWKNEDLLILESAYEELASAVKNAVGPARLWEFSHIWGAGGVIARRGKLTVKGQFGEVYSNEPWQVNVVINIGRVDMSTQTIAQRIAHETAHSRDYLLGETLPGKKLSWSESTFANIFNLCDLPAAYETSLMPCYKKHPDWFNFHSTAYSAICSAEFYTKMLDEWVRGNLKLVKLDRYRCQNNITESLWQEMEINLIGEVISSACK